MSSTVAIVLGVNCWIHQRQWDTKQMQFIDSNICFLIWKMPSNSLLINAHMATVLFVCSFVWKMSIFFSFAVANRLTLHLIRKQWTLPHLCRRSISIICYVSVHQLRMEILSRDTHLIDRQFKIKSFLINESNKVKHDATMTWHTANDRNEANAPRQATIKERNNFAFCRHAVHFTFNYAMNWNEMSERVRVCHFKFIYFSSLWLCCLRFFFFFFGSFNRSEQQKRMK